MMSIHLTDTELIDVTHRRQPCAQARELKRMGVPFKRRIDGTLLVGRAAIERALSDDQPTLVTQPASNGLNWSKRA